MKRWERTLRNQVSIVTRHTNELINRLVYLNNRRLSIINTIGLNQHPDQLNKLQKIEDDMYGIVTTLELVEPWFFKGWSKAMQEVYITTKRDKDEAQVQR